MGLSATVVYREGNERKEEEFRGKGCQWNSWGAEAFAMLGQEIIGGEKGVEFSDRFYSQGVFDVEDCLEFIPILKESLGRIPMYADHHYKEKFEALIAAMAFCAAYDEGAVVIS